VKPVDFVGDDRPSLLAEQNGALNPVGGSRPTLDRESEGFQSRT
jgi:hypothetical protein